MIRRPPRSTPTPSSAASDVYKRQGQESFAKAVEFGASSIDVEILCYSAERDYSHYTDLKQKLVHKVMEIVRENGSDFAFPSRSVYVESSHEIES